MKVETLVNYDFSEFQLPLIAIYHNPSDFPGKFVARVYDLNEASPVHMVKNSLEEIRNRIPLEMSRLNRHQDDDPVIVEVWV